MTIGKTESQALNELEEYRVRNRMKLDELQRKIDGFRDSNAGLVELGKYNGFKKSRKIRNVTMIWQEYIKGIDGKPSVLSMEKHYGAKWRQEVSDQRLLKCRKPIYDAVWKLIDSGMSDKDAVSALDASGYQKTWTLAKLNAAVRSIIETRKPSQYTFDE